MRQVKLAQFWTEHKPSLSKSIKPEVGEWVIVSGKANLYYQGEVRVGNP